MNMLAQVASFTVLALSTAACMVGDGADGDGDVTVIAGHSTGNGALSGTHYQVNIIGVSNTKNVNLSGGSGARIFVALNGTTKINLQEGPFGVLDANGTDGTALFQLPNPDPDGDGVTAYSVYARALGTPGGMSTTTTCAYDKDGTLVCSEESMVLIRGSGGSKFTNVSRDLLYVIADLDGDGVVEKTPLFSDALQDYYWNYDNNGLRNAQLRFYDTPTNTN